QLEQHRQHAFGLSVEMSFVPGEAPKPVWVDGLEGLRAKQWAIPKLLSSLFVPRQGLSFQEAPKALCIRLILFLALLVIAGLPAARLLPPCASIIAQRGHWTGVGRGRWARQNSQRRLGHGLVLFEIRFVFRGFLICRANCLTNRGILNVVRHTDQRRLGSVLIFRGTLEGAMMRSPLA